MQAAREIAQREVEEAKAKKVESALKAQKDRSGRNRPSGSHPAS